MEVENSIGYGVLKMKVKLITDFLDYYDHRFDNDGVVFERLSAGGMK